MDNNKFRVYSGCINKIRENGYQFDGKTFTVDFEASGTMYEGRTATLESMNTGDCVKLKREKDNPYGDTSIEILNLSGKSLGYVECNVADLIAPLMDNDLIESYTAVISKLEKLSQRSKHCRKALLYVKVSVRLKERPKPKNDCIVCLLGGDQTRLWAQKITVMHCDISLSDAELIFECYNRERNEYDECNDVYPGGLDNMYEEALEAKDKRLAEKAANPQNHYGPDVDNDSRMSEVFKMIENERIEYVFQRYCFSSETYFWWNMIRVTEEEFDEQNPGGYHHWYDIAELFDSADFPLDFNNEDTLTIFGTHKFKAFADLSYGC